MWWRSFIKFRAGQNHIFLILYKRAGLNHLNSVLTLLGLATTTHLKAWPESLKLSADTIRVGHNHAFKGLA